jgi:hypothetical protein
LEETAVTRVFVRSITAADAMSCISVPVNDGIGVPVPICAPLTSWDMVMS